MGCEDRGARGGDSPCTTHAPRRCWPKKHARVRGTHKNAPHPLTPSSRPPSMEAGVLARSAAPGVGLCRRGVVRPSGEAPPRSGGGGRPAREAVTSDAGRRCEVEATGWCRAAGRRVRGMSVGVGECGVRVSAGVVGVPSARAAISWNEEGAQVGGGGRGGGEGGRSCASFPLSLGPGIPSSLCAPRLRPPHGPRTARATPSPLLRLVVLCVRLCARALLSTTKGAASRHLCRRRRGAQPAARPLPFVLSPSPPHHTMAPARPGGMQKPVRYPGWIDSLAR